MPAADLNSKDDVEDLATSSKRTSMLKKTMNAFGKVKPIFKKGKRRSHQMELFDSCSSLDFDIAELNHSEHDGEVDEELDTTDMTSENADADEDQQANTTITWRRNDTPPLKKQDPERKSQVSYKPSTATSAPSTPTSLQRGILNGRGMSQVAPQLDEAFAASVDEEAPSADFSKPVRKRSTHRKPGNRSPLPKKSASSKSKPSGKIPPVPEQSEAPASCSPRKTAPSPTASALPDELKSPKMSAKSLIQGLPEHVQNENPHDKVEDNEESFIRLSMAFGKDSGMGSYFAKLQELKHKETVKPQSYNVPVEKNIDGSKPKSAHDLGKGGDDKSSRHFKATKNIKKLLGLKKATSIDASKASLKPSKAVSNVGTGGDEAAKLMLELSSMLSPTREERPMRAHNLRHTLTFGIEEVYDDDDATQEFPEIPTEKRTSLSDIRRMMDSSKVELPLSPSRNIKKSVGQQRSCIEHSRVSKAHHNPSHRSMPVDHQKSTKHDLSERSLKSKKTAKDTKSPISVTDAQSSEENEKDDSEIPTPSVADEAMYSPSGRKKRHRHPKATISESPHLSDEGENPQERSMASNLVGKKEEDPSNLNVSSSHSTQRRRRGGSRTSTPIQDAIPEDEVIENSKEPKSPREGSCPSSPGSLRKRKSSQRRSSDKRGPKETPSDSSSTRSSSTVEAEAPQLDKVRGVLKGIRADTSDGVEQRNVNKNADIGKGSPHGIRRPRRIDSKTKVASDHKHQNQTGSSEDRRKNYNKSSSTGTMGKLPLDSFSSPSRRHHKRPERSTSEKQACRSSVPTGDSATKKEVLAILSSPTKHKIIRKSEEQKTGEDEAESKSKIPSLSSSLKNGSLKRMLLNDGQCSVSTDGGSEMFVSAKVSYAAIRSDDSVKAPQLIIRPEETKSTNDLPVKNI